MSKLEEEGRLEEYLETEPNFMYSLLADGRLTDDEVNSIISDLFGAGIDSVSCEREHKGNSKISNNSSCLYLTTNVTI